MNDTTLIILSYAVGCLVSAAIGYVVCTYQVDRLKNDLAGAKENLATQTSRRAQAENVAADLRATLKKWTVRPRAKGGRFAKKKKGRAS